MARASPTVFLFDVDGTLISTDGAGRRAIERAFCTRHGEHVKDAACRFSFAGMTDRAIARAGLKALGVDVDESAITALLDAYVGLLDDVLSASPPFKVHDGIVAALDAAAAREGTALGLGTGNLRAGAQKKLVHARLWHRFEFGGFADDSEDRAELVLAGARRGAGQLGVALARCRVVVVGDTPLDVAAARANGFESFAVATGVHPIAELAGSGADHAFESLGAAGALERLLGGSDSVS